jgi:hypothetical protein
VNKLTPKSVRQVCFVLLLLQVGQLEQPMERWLGGHANPSLHPSSLQVGHSSLSPCPLQAVLQQ